MPKLSTKVLVPILAAACAVSVSACKAQTTSEQEADQTTTTSDSTEQTTRRVGKVGVGYVTVPSDWISLATKSGSGDIEFCDITATKIITMKVMDSSDVDIIASKNAEASASTTTNGTTTSGTTDTSKSENASTSTSGTSENSSTSTTQESSSTASNGSTSTSGTTSSSSTDKNASSTSSSSTESSDTVTIEDAVKAIIYHAKEYDVTDDNIQQEQTTLANRDATKLMTTYGDGTKVICWVLLDDSGNVRYVAAEAPSDSVDEVAAIVESTYSF